jgi:hypothetical protein
MILRRPRPPGGQANLPGRLYLDFPRQHSPDCLRAHPRHLMSRRRKHWTGDLRLGSCLKQLHVAARALRQNLFLAAEAIAKPPPLGTVRIDERDPPGSVSQPVGIRARCGTSDRDICKWYGGRSKSMRMGRSKGVRFSSSIRFGSAGNWDSESKKLHA